MNTSNIYTIGHSTHEFSAFAAMLKKKGVTLLADVRTFPRSRHNPQFNIDTLPETLASVGIEYVHLKELGGRRHALSESINKGWQSEAFRGFADYMQTVDFAQGLDTLIDLVRQHVVVIMCAEAVPWRCHRSLIGDALFVRGVTVQHILPGGQSRLHTLTSFARYEEGRLTYPVGE